MSDTATQPATHAATKPATPVKRQIVSFRFFRVAPECKGRLKYVSRRGVYVDYPRRPQTHIFQSRFLPVGADYGGSAQRPEVDNRAVEKSYEIRNIRIGRYNQFLRRSFRRPSDSHWPSRPPRLR